MAAQQFGYSAFLFTAYKVVTFLALPPPLLAQLEAHGAQCDALRVRFLEFAARAMLLMAHSRPDSPQHGVEVSFVKAWQEASSCFTLRPEIPAHQQVLSAWEELQRSGALRNFQLHAMYSHVQEAQVHVRAASRVAAYGLRACAHAACGAREVHATQFQRCSACQAVVYCCREHQLADWPGHKAACKAARERHNVE